MQKFLSLQPDYDDIEDENQIKLMARGKSDKGKDNKKYGKWMFITQLIDHSSFVVLVHKPRRDL